MNSLLSYKESLQHICTLQGCESAWVTFMSDKYRAVLRGKTLHVQHGGKPPWGLISPSSGLMEPERNKSVVRLTNVPTCGEEETKLTNGDERETDGAHEASTYLLFNFLQLVALFADVVQQLHGLVILSGDLHSCLLQASLQALHTQTHTHGRCTHLLASCCGWDRCCRATTCLTHTHT